MGINYPKTIVVDKNNYDKTKISFKCPFIAKVSNKAMYQRLSFEGKEKVFLFKSLDEYKEMMKRLFASGYDDTVVVQEYIKGTDANMRVLTCFADQNSNVIFSSVGKVLLEEKGPDVTGNYSAIYNTEDEKIVENFFKSMDWDYLLNISNEINEAVSFIKLFQESVIFNPAISSIFIH